MDRMDALYRGNAANRYQYHEAPLVQAISKAPLLLLAPSPVSCASFMLFGPTVARPTELSPAADAPQVPAERLAMH